MFVRKTTFFKLLINFGFVIIALGSLSACDLAQNHLKSDREGGMTMQDFRDGLAPRPVEQNNQASDQDIPDLQSYVADPDENLRAMPLVSISINQTVPLRDALFELAKEADYDIELDSNISGSIIFSARNKPFDTVLDRICDIAGLRYKIEDGSVRIEEDRPYLKNYKINYLNYIRESSSTISSSTDVVSGDGADTGSEFESSSESVADFWLDLETGLTQLLGTEAESGGLRSKVTPQISALDTTGTPGVAAQPEGSEVVVQVSSLPPLDSDVAGGDSDSSASTSGEESVLFAMNRHAGIVSVFAPQRKHKEVKSYLDDVKKSVTAQVLIEAKVVEVELSDEYSIGINWSDLFPNTSDISVVPAFGNPGFIDGSTVAGSPSPSFIVGLSNWDINATVDALSHFGTTRALSSPRITVLNNQPAALNVATNLVYFEVEVEVEAGRDGADDTVTVETDIGNVPEGVLINVLPSIDLDNNTVSLAIRPTITNVDEFAEDPVVPLTIALSSSTIDADLLDTLENSNLSSQIPVVEVQEFDTVIEVPSGKPVILGGLMQDRHQTIESGVPVLSEIPGVGSAFKNHRDQVQKIELVVFLRATILEKDVDNIHQTDREIYQKFMSDRRPFDLN